MNLFVLNLNPRIAAKDHADIHVNKMIVETAQMLSTAQRVLTGSPTLVWVEKVVPKPSYKLQEVYILPNEALTYMPASNMEIPEGVDVEQSPYLLAHSDRKAYMTTHVNHPSARWVRESRGNYIYALSLMLYLIREYKNRYVKRSHAVERLVEQLKTIPPTLNGYQTAFELAMPEDFHGSDAIESYRAYYRSKAESMDMSWRNGEPDWWQQHELSN